ncbi:MAG: cobalt-precorrin 5A hydrolase [Oscillospiraceae bacterium]|nr:cobalt-precorrin 5A hydrolase [Oscillospiraceae bacterium]
MRKIAVISLTERGRALSHCLQSRLADFQIYRFCFFRHSDAQAENFESLANLTEQIFPQYEALVFICACGIAVRMIAPHICSKQTDPAVIVMDECGTHVISLLSGHLGGANALTQIIADRVNANAVITTATDIGGLFSPDSFAKANQLIIADMNAAKEIAAAVLRQETIGLGCRFPCCNLPSQIRICNHAKYGIVIADTMEIAPYPVTLHLIPRNIVLGIGCKKGTSVQQITRAVMSALEQYHILPQRICKAASIDLKAHEAGLLEFCGQMDIPLETFSAGQLMQADGDFEHSVFVQKITGADNICERSAVLCSGGTLKIPKTALDGVTVAACEMNIEIDFERRML